RLLGLRERLGDLLYEQGEVGGGPDLGRYQHQAVRQDRRLRVEGGGIFQPVAHLLVRVAERLLGQGFRLLLHPAVEVLHPVEFRLLAALGFQLGGGGRGGVREGGVEVVLDLLQLPPLVGLPVGGQALEGGQGNLEGHGGGAGDLGCVRIHRNLLSGRSGGADHLGGWAAPQSFTYLL